MHEKKRESTWETIRTLIYAMLIALVVRAFAFEPFNIPSGSMIPTLLVGDYLFVSKYSYGYSRYSLPLGLPLFSGRVFAHLPERGDVAVFRKPTEPSVDFIKRIVGLPGDRMQVRGGVLYINGTPTKRDQVEDYVVRDAFGTHRRTQYLETLPNGRVHPILKISDHEALDDTQEYVVPAGHVFAMGDNRDNSKDSRVLDEVGYIPIENLVGRAEFLFFSIDEGAHFWEVWKWPTAIRFGRIFHTIK